jgi:hypothetical protein
MASVCEMMPPAAVLNRAQLVPNWNSRGMPVTTPIMKPRANTRTQKRAALVGAGGELGSSPQPPRP